MSQKKGRQEKPTVNTVYSRVCSTVEGFSETKRDTQRAAFLHLMQSLTGTDVSVEGIDGTTYSGVFHTATPFPRAKYSVVLKCTKETKADGTVGAGSNAIIDGDQIRTIKTSKLDLSSKNRVHEFQTDKSIRKQDISHLAGRQLESVDDSWLSPQTTTSLEANTGGWDQFETNKRLFNVNSTYNEDLYTKKLDMSSMTPAQIAQAERLAREIEGNVSGNIHLQEERGQLQEREMDEEDMYSGVIRDTSSNNNFYAAPQQPQRVSYANKVANGSGASSPAGNVWQRGAPLGGASPATVATKTKPAGGREAQSARTKTPVDRASTVPSRSNDIATPAEPAKSSVPASPMSLPPGLNLPATPQPESVSPAPKEASPPVPAVAPVRATTPTAPAESKEKSAAAATSPVVVAASPSPHEPETEKPATEKPPTQATVPETPEPPKPPAPKLSAAAKPWVPNATAKAFVPSFTTNLGAAVPPNILPPGPSVQVGGLPPPVPTSTGVTSPSNMIPKPQQQHLAPQQHVPYGVSLPPQHMMQMPPQIPPQVPIQQIPIPVNEFTPQRIRSANNSIPSSPNVSSLVAPSPSTATIDTPVEYQNMPPQGTPGMIADPGVGYEGGYPAEMGMLPPNNAAGWTNANMAAAPMMPMYPHWGMTVDPSMTMMMPQMQMVPDYQPMYHPMYIDTNTGQPMFPVVMPPNAAPQGYPMMAPQMAQIYYNMPAAVLPQQYVMTQPGVPGNFPAQQMTSPTAGIAANSNKPYSDRPRSNSGSFNGNRNMNNRNKNNNYNSGGGNRNNNNYVNNALESIGSDAQQQPPPPRDTE